ncbi:hypothetical protein NUU61_005683 [Penicillium alfredii]|uniref:Uncharacterized protein n=1 Tax=Penicillium alfredii TaxID=1506179 RepID=A0A9W9F9V9_9EURO|nr:uncharacterized protein NUU61_005683 [Penicillium alfredii]KAJ5096327.1 hypothetical protein NUU61_005683 [Penicillium alfredii]
MPSANNPTLQYDITHSVWAHNYDIAVHGSHVIHVDNSSLTPGKPDLTFHSGPNSHAQVVGVCKFEHFSTGTKIGLGDPKQPSKMIYEKMLKDGIMSPRYSFRVNIGGYSRHLTWKKTHSMGTGPSGNFKLVDDTSQRVLAVFSSASAFSFKTGNIALYVDHGEPFRLMTLMTGIAVRESLRRRRSSSAAAGGGGGGA